VYEAHITKADGTEVAVEVDKSFAVTGEEQGGPWWSRRAPRATTTAMVPACPATPRGSSA
jgi:hypothetical protein